MSDFGACLWSLTPGVSPQACAGGEEEESEEGGGSTAAHLLEALRQFRLHHRGQYRTVLEESLAAFHLHGEESAAEGAGEGRRICVDDDGNDDDNDGDDDGQEQPATPPSPPSPPPSPANAEPESSQDAPAPESDTSSK